MSILFASASSQLVSMGSGSGALNAVNEATLMAWVNPVTLAAGDHSVIGLSNGLTVGASRAKLGCNGGGNVRGNGRCLDADANQNFLGTAGKVTTGSWQHIAATFDYVNKLIRVYYNGVLDATSAVVTWGASPTSATNSLAFNMGSTHGGASEFFDGYVDDARVYSRLLSAGEIATIHAARGGDAILAGLEHRFQLQEGAPGVTVAGAGVVKDVSDRKFNGTPGGTTSPTWQESALISRRRLVA